MILILLAVGGLSAVLVYLISGTNSRPRKDPESLKQIENLKRVNAEYERILLSIAADDVGDPQTEAKLVIYNMKTKKD